MPKVLRFPLYGFALLAGKKWQGSKLIFLSLTSSAAVLSIT